MDGKRRRMQMRMDMAISVVMGALESAVEEEVRGKDAMAGMVIERAVSSLDDAISGSQIYYMQKR